MAKKTRSLRGRRGSITLFVALSMPIMLGVAALGMDGTMLYIVQTELAAAVDGAALGAGRLLSTNANPTDIATEFLNANFRVGQPGFWGAHNLTPTITVVTGTSKTVTITANVTVPTMFARLIGVNSTTVAATATATRRDTRIEFVIDRSGSMQPVIANLITYAQGFTEQFTNGYDEMGLVVFSGSAVVGYPATPWPSGLSPTGTGGPNNSFYNGASTDMVHQIGLIDANGGTATGEGLALAYIELQKAHMRDMAANGNDPRMNAIVLFTDGVPSSAPVYLNKNGSSVISNGSPCNNKIDTSPPTNPMYGYVAESGYPPYSHSSAQGFYQLGSLDTANTQANYLGNGSLDYTFPNPKTPESGCNSASNISNNWYSLSYLTAIPSFDKYGYSFSPNGNGYKVSAFTSTPNHATSIYTGTAFSTADGTDGYQWGLAEWDEADQVAEAIRTDANYANRAGDTSQMNITIYTIGYTGTNGTDYGLLQKLANMPGSSANNYSTYNDNEPPGLYVQASDTTALANAFSTIATAILRLSH